MENRETCALRVVQIISFKNLKHVALWCTKDKYIYLSIDIYIFDEIVDPAAVDVWTLKVLWPSCWKPLKKTQTNRNWLCSPSISILRILHIFHLKLFYNINQTATRLLRQNWSRLVFNVLSDFEMKVKVQERHVSSRPQHLDALPVCNEDPWRPMQIPLWSYGPADVHVTNDIQFDEQLFEPAAGRLAPALKLGCGEL